MPGKHVRFAPDVAISPSPSPTFSHASLPSSSGSMVSPSLSQFGSPYSPLPPTHTQIHPVLGMSRSPHLKFDVSLPTSNIVPRDPTLSEKVLMEPATNPPLPYIAVVSRSLLEPIIARPAKTGTYVTVYDVLLAIYSSLRTNVTPKQFGACTDYAQRLINDAYVRRYMRIPDAATREVERQKGLKRVDFLLDKHTFMGLSTTAEGPDVWEISLS